jgi:hypothetical protein
VEGYIDGGKLFVAQALKTKVNDNGLEIKGDLKIHRFDLFELESIWKQE